MITSIQATLKYDFPSSLWIIVADWDARVWYSGTTPEEAVESMRHDCNKHDLWPKL
jgi:hypothetical protein